MLGKIFEVSTVARGSYATVDHAAGATTLYVQDGSDFDDAGTLTVLDATGVEVPVTYTRVDDVLTVAPLPVAVGEDAPILVVQKASWPGEEKIVRGTIRDIKRKCQDEKIASQAMILASPALGARMWPDIARSKLYDPGFGHRFRKASMPAGIATGESA